jgi:hypothetical protein
VPQSTDGQRHGLQQVVCVCVCVCVWELLLPTNEFRAAAGCGSSYGVCPVKKSETLAAAYHGSLRPLDTPAASTSCRTVNCCAIVRGSAGEGRPKRFLPAGPSNRRHVQRGLDSCPQTRLQIADCTVPNPPAVCTVHRCRRAALTPHADSRDLLRVPSSRVDFRLPLNLRQRARRPGFSSRNLPLSAPWILLAFLAPLHV